MTLDSVKKLQNLALQKWHGQVNAPGGRSSSFLSIYSYLFVRSEIFIRISCDQPCQPCQQDGGGPFYNCAHVVLHNVRVRLPVAAAVNNLNVLPSEGE